MAQIDPIVAPALFPGGQKSFSDWLFGGLKQNPDGGWDLSPLQAAPSLPITDPTQTNLPNVWNAWNPQGNAGMQGLVDYFTKNQGGIGTPDPLSLMMMQQGGFGGPGFHGMGSMLSSGMSSPGAGGNLANFAQGNPVGSAAYLLPFLTGSINSSRQAQAPTFSPGYRAPNVIPRFGDGGVVTKPTLAMVGEKGPEAIVPLKKGQTEPLTNPRDYLQDYWNEPGNELKPEDVYSKDPIRRITALAQSEGIHDATAPMVASFLATNGAHPVVRALLTALSQVQTYGRK